MSGTDLGASEFLGRRAAQVVYGIPDGALRERVVRAILVCDDALEVVDAIELTPHELARDDVPSLETWNALAPDVRNLLIAVRKASGKILELFPPPPEQEQHDTTSIDLDLDQAFDAMEKGELPEPIRDRRDHEIDRIVGGVNVERTAEELGRAIAALAGMLQADFVSFGQRLQNPAVVGDRWFLLSELQEMRQKCSQALEAVVATILKAFTDEELELVLPRYQTSAARAQRLRTAVVDLAHDVSLLNEQAKAGGLGDLVAIRQALVLRLNELADQPVYLYVRPLDKREIIRFRRRLDDLSVQSDTAFELKRAVEGFSKFLDVMKSINDREVLMRTDRAHVQTIRMLLESEEEVEEARPLLELVYGRDAGLDVLVRELRETGAVDPERLLAEVARVDDAFAATTRGPAW